MPSLIARVRAFIAPFHDPRAWAAILVCALIVWMIDPVMIKTVIVWALQAGIFFGFATIASRLIFHQIDLQKHIDGARAGNVADGLIVLAVLLVVALFALAFAIFARAL